MIPTTQPMFEITPSVVTSGPVVVPCSTRYVIVSPAANAVTVSGGSEGVGRAVNQAVVITFLGIFAFNYVFTQTLLATHPEISVIK